MFDHLLTLIFKTLQKCELNRLNIYGDRLYMNQVMTIYCFICIIIIIKYEWQKSWTFKTSLLTNDKNDCYFFFFFN